MPAGRSNSDGRSVTWRSAIAAAESVGENRYAGDLGNTERSSGHEPRVHRQAIGFGEHLGPEPIAVIQLGDRGEGVSRPDRVGDEGHLAHVVLERLERRAVR